MKRCLLHAWLFLSGRYSLLAFSSIERNTTKVNPTKMAFVVAMFFLVSFSADATTWYVDSGATGLHNGTSWTDAWTSLTQISGVKGGDVVYISGGPSGQTRSYTTPTSAWNIASGTAANPIIYQIGQDSQHNGTAIFDGSGSSQGTWLYAGNCTGVTISGDAGDGKMHFALANWNSIASANNATMLTLSYINFGSMPSGIDFNPGDGVQIDHCYCYMSSATADHFSYLSGNNSSGNPWGRNKAFCNTIYVPHLYASSGGGKGADCFQWNGTSIDLYSNMVVGYAMNYTGGQHQDGEQALGGSYMRIHDNVFMDIANYPLFGDGYYSSFNYCQMYNNIACFSDSALAATAPPQAGGWGVDGGWSLGTVNMTDTIVCNNLAVDYGGHATWNFGYSTSNPYNYVNCFLANNISINGGGSSIVCPEVTDVDNAFSISTSVASNIFVRYVPFGGTNNDFHLKANAATLIGQGTNLTQFFTADIDGNLRPATGSWDIGPYQYSSSTNRPPTTNYTITASAGTGGSIAPSGPVSVSAGSSQTFTITPSGGYAISTVQVDGTNFGTVSTYTFSNVTTNHTISASFASTGVTPPSTPANLSATPVSPSEIDLSWTASAAGSYAIAGYHIYLNGATTPSASVTTAAYNSTGLLANTTNSYVITAYDTHGNESSQSSIAAVTWPPLSTKFSSNQQVQVLATANIRQQPTNEVAGAVIGTQPAGAIATIVGGPIYAAINGVSYYWWNLSFSSSPSGWVAEDNLQAYSAPVNPIIQVSANNIAFGTVLSGTGLTNSFTVSNAGGGTLSGTASVSAPFNIVSGGTYNLASNQSQTVTVSFNPITAGNYSQNVTLTGGNGATVGLTAAATNAVANPVIQVSPTSLAFGTILSGTSKTNSFSVKNIGGGTLTGTAGVASPYSIVSGGSYSLASNQSQTVTVLFNPTVAGTYNQNITLTGGGGATLGLTAVATNAPAVIPTVSAITMNVTDVDFNLSGLQIYSGTTVQFSATATNAQTWQWNYSVNGGSPVVYSRGTGPVTNVSYYFDTNTIGNSYLWSLVVSNGQAGAVSSTNFAVEAAPPVGTVITNIIQGPTIAATSGKLTSLLTASTTINGVSTTYFYQPLPSIGNTSGGTAVYNVTITNAGNYEIQALVYAPNINANSFLVNIDGQPQNPTQIWDIMPVTSGFEQRLVCWRGATGSENNDSIVPVVFNLSAGTHQITFVGREPGTGMASFSLLQIVTTVQSPSPPAAPTGLRIISSAF